MQQKLEKGRLLNEKGQLRQVGYHTEPVAEYNRKHILKRKWQIKEWDYYIVSNGKQAVALTIADNSYMAFVSATLLNFDTKQFTTKSTMKFFTFGKLNLPSSPREGDVSYSDKKISMSFKNQDNVRTLKCDIPNFSNKQPFSCQLVLTDVPRDQMVIVTPFFKKHAFYYNCKINCMTAEGFAKLGDEVFEFSPTNSLGTLDWGRGIWTYKNTWYWGSLQCLLPDGKKFGFNIGYGFGDTSKASENMIFVDGIHHKLDKVTFHIPVDKNGKDDFLSPWKFSSSDGRFEMDFKPILDRADSLNIGLIATNQHQVFGLFSGTVILDDGSKLEISNQLGFAEKVYNKW